jgi:hypothetical protein
MYDDDSVDLWYRNNIVVYTRTEYPSDYKLDFIHPQYYYQIGKHLKG